MARNIRPNIYNLGSHPRFVLETTDIDGNEVLPTLARISIERPDGTLVTVSGGAMTVDGNTYVYQYANANLEGFYFYEGWIRDSAGREAANSKGFYVYNEVGD